MSQPRVTAVMLTANRMELADKAVQCFDAQTYRRKSLVILNTGEQKYWSRTHPSYREARAGRSLGELRNHVNTLAGDTDILVHWDDDDYSDFWRIEAQVAQLQCSGARCVGYNEMLFWDTRGPSEAWLYSNPNPAYALGTSLCYWRAAWEARQFPLIDHGEDTEWLQGVASEGVSAQAREPRMIARIHGGNSSNAYCPIEMARHNALPRMERQWSRAAEFDDYCRKVCK